jgi:hypothetical protein
MCGVSSLALELTSPAGARRWRFRRPATDMTNLAGGAVRIIGGRRREAPLSFMCAAASSARASGTSTHYHVYRCANAA